MNRLKEIEKFLLFANEHEFIIETAIIYKAIRENLIDIVTKYNPEVIVKAGLGRGKILLDLAEKSNSTIVVVEPSIKIIQQFLKENEGNTIIKKIKIINGDFHDFPVDYDKVNLLICIDYLDIFDSSISVDEFKRTLKIEGILFFSGVVLGDDNDGIYDDLMRIMFPLHNDYYLKNDLNTFMELKKFTLLNSTLIKYRKNLQSIIDLFGKIFNNIKDNAVSFIENHSEQFEKIYGMDRDNNIFEFYYSAIYLKSNIE